MKKTKINEAHYLLKGKMVEFCGWDLPVQYSGVNTEHVAVRTTGGIFDVSHMGEIWFRGREALRAVQHLISNDASKLAPGRIQYAGLLTENGCFVDDLLVYMIRENEYLLVVNAANVEKDFLWMKKHTAGFDVQLEDRSEEYSQIAVQGPVAEKLLQEFTEIDLQPMGYYHFAQGRVQGMDAIVSRTGYTGEDGFEIYFKSDAAAASKLFLDLAGKGEKYDALPAGLGARDTLRLEAKMARLWQRYRRQPHGAGGRPGLDTQAQEGGALHRPGSAGPAETGGHPPQAGGFRAARQGHRPPWLPDPRGRQGLRCRHVGDFRPIPEKTHRLGLSAR